jgi:hypothetical protein
MHFDLFPATSILKKNALSFPDVKLVEVSEDVDTTSLPVIFQNRSINIPAFSVA